MCISQLPERMTGDGCMLGEMDVDGVTKGADEFVEQVLGPMA